MVPMWLSARRGSLLLLFIGLVICPWNLVNAPSTFITVLSAFGTFMSPFIGIYIADYWIVRRKCYRVPDLYIGNSTSVYWYQYGFSVRAFGSWFLIVWMALRKFSPATSVAAAPVSLQGGATTDLGHYATIQRVLPSLSIKARVALHGSASSKSAS